MYDPSPLEWAGLLAFLGASALSTLSFFSSAMIAGWWRLSLQRLLPSQGWTVFFSIGLAVASGGFAVGTWLSWAEAVRGDDPGLAPRSSDFPTNGLLVSTMILYFIFFGLQFCLGPIFFGFPTWRGPSFLIFFLIVSAGIALTVLAFIAWWVAGVVDLVAVLLLSFLLGLAYRYWKASTVVSVVGIVPTTHGHAEDFRVGVGR